MVGQAKRAKRAGPTSPLGRWVGGGGGSRVVLGNRLAWLRKTRDLQLSGADLGSTGTRESEQEGAVV